MCFNFSFSALVTTAGFASAGFLYYKKAPWQVYVSIAYFSLMDLLQALGYLVVDNTGSYIYIFLPYLIYLHVCFQPLFMNLWIAGFLPSKNSVIVSGQTSPRREREEFSYWAIRICLIGGLLLAARMINYDPSIGANEVFASTAPSIYVADHHIAFTVPLTKSGYFFPTINLHFFLFFIPMIVVGFWRLALFLFLLGPVLARLLIQDANVRPMVWCLLFIPILLISVIYYYRKSAIAMDK